MAGLIRWLAPHLGYTAPSTGTALNAPAAWAGTGSTEQTTPNPTPNQTALQNAFRRFGAANITPAVLTHPYAHASWVGGLTPLKPPAARPPLTPPGGFNLGNDLAPSSIRVDFHPPPEPSDSLSLGGSQPLQ